VHDQSSTGAVKKGKMQLKQVVRPLPIEIDDEPELIDLSALFTSTSDEDPTLNERIVVEQPVRWWINESGGSVKLYKDGRLDGEIKGTSRYQLLCIDFPRDTSRLWRTTLGERIKPTQISSLLSQNTDGASRSPNFCYKWDQPDEGYYKARAKEGLAEFIADTGSNYFCVPYASKYRYLFKCPDLEKIIATISSARGTAETEYDDTEYNKVMSTMVVVTLSYHRPTFSRAISLFTLILRPDRPLMYVQDAPIIIKRYLAAPAIRLSIP